VLQAIGYVYKVSGITSWCRGVRNMKARLLMVIANPSTLEMPDTPVTARESTTITIGALGGECRPLSFGYLRYDHSWSMKDKDQAHWCFFGLILWYQLIVTSRRYMFCCMLQS
jgi:hypothetical protein